MKNIIYLLALSLVFTSCGDDPFSKVKSENVEKASVRDNTPSKFPVMTFDKKDHDFGTIMNGTPVETIFKYTNTGNSMLVVSNIKSTCGCTVPSNYTKEVAPGETGQFTVKFNGKGNGKVSKSLTMTTNTEKGTQIVKITAMVEQDPNAPQQQPGKATINPLSTSNVKTSTQPGHEGHNHN